jgi:FixJ family two-component response regulator
LSEPTVHVVDDDESIRELLSWLMKREGIQVRAYATAHAFLQAWRDDGPACVVLDLHLPGMSGLELQQKLLERGCSVPVVFLSGRADVPNAVSAVKKGAVDFIEKPFDYRTIVALIREWLGRDAQARVSRARSRQAAERLASLTQREREILDCVVAGKINRVIAEDLAISVKTVEAHRARIMEKLAVDSVAELVQVVVAAGQGDPGR